MENRNKLEVKLSGRSDDENKAGEKVGTISNAQIKVKPEIVREVPKDIGRHGSDQENDLNPEE